MGSLPETCPRPSFGWQAGTFLELFAPTAVVQEFRQARPTTLSHEPPPSPVSCASLSHAMRESDWRVWLDGLPLTRPQLQDVQAQLQRQIVLIEGRLSTAIWQRDTPGQRAFRIELNELNSKLMLIHTRVNAA